MADFLFLPALLGGMLIGMSATLLLLLNGRIAGISGICSGAIFGADRRWRWFFLLGLVLGGWIYRGAIAPQPTPVDTFSPWAMLVGGALVGFGTRLGHGCTSGHGVCGLGRLSARSLAAVVSFLATGFVTVFVTRHILGLG